MAQSAQAAAAPPPWDALDQIQGFIVRGYRAQLIRYFALTVNDAAAARAFLTALAPLGGPLRVTNATDWGDHKPPFCLNVGFTFRGLKALGVPDDSLQSFADSPGLNSFTVGAVGRADFVGDVGPSAPDNPQAPWLVSDQDFDVMVMVSAWALDALDAASRGLMGDFEGGFDAPGPDRVFDSQALPDDQVYFGYRDNIAQPMLKDSPFDRAPEGPQDEVDPGAFVLGAASDGVFGPGSLPLPKPDVLGRYGSFGTFRILKQDVDGFEAHVKSLAPGVGALFGITDPDLQADAVKAKICGRWPNGTPLAVCPTDGNNPPPAFPPDKINDFGFADDKYGIKCPVGAHIRRNNPRDSGGQVPEDHRILRRAMPYSRPDPNNPGKDEVGLMGLFLGVSFTLQFEFLMNSWIHKPVGIVSDMADPMVGLNVKSPGGPFKETIMKAAPKQRDDWTTFPMESFVFTRAGAYVFFPAIPGLQWIASGSPAAA